MQRRAARAKLGAMEYRITVEGRLSDWFAPAFDGMSLESANGHTTLKGEVVDQAQLYGLIVRLRDFGVELIEVERTGRQ
jgi:hypothetical protein